MIAGGLAVAGVVAGVAVSCARQQSRPKGPEMKPLAVSEQAAAVAQDTEAEGGYVVQWAGVLANPNRWHYGEHPVALVTAYDAAGNVLTRVEQQLDVIPPNGRLAFAGQAELPRQPQRVVVRQKDATWQRATRVPSAFAPFTVSDVLTEKDAKQGTYRVVGRVANPYSRQAGLVVTALLRDASGRLVGGGSGYVKPIKPGEDRAFYVSARPSDPAAKVTKTEVVAGTWGGTRATWENLTLNGLRPVHTTKPTSKPLLDRGRG
ncbi:hypothetical protein D5H75_35830 [Bailinhaonella thermotolerans]|uniref:Uncharacterized protein n=1 Tax=Bailinhaonella thermotolerans TaxID=1070861 RepID=A0A3A4AMV8_9ACTN|nr:hypothetical protein D5H75_35830 [Bailinhaonella thermotolerans]